MKDQDSFVHNMNSFHELGATVCDILYFLQLFSFSEYFFLHFTLNKSNTANFILKSNISQNLISASDEHQNSTLIYINLSNNRDSMLFKTIGNRFIVKLYSKFIERSFSSVAKFYIPPIPIFINWCDFTTYLHKRKTFMLAF